QERLAKLHALRTVIEALLDLAPSQTTSVREGTRQAITFLERFGPFEANDADAPALERKALADIIENLDQVGASAAPFEAPARQMARLLRELVAETRFGAEGPHPGALHVVPLSQAGYAGRDHLIVVGLDEQSMAQAANEDPLLLDRQRARLNDALGRQLPLRRQLPGAVRWTVLRALSRHVGPLTAITSTQDLAAGRSLEPSTLYRQLRALASEDAAPERAALVPSPDALALDDGEAWLTALHPGEASEESAPADSADDASAPRRHLASAYPALGRGLRAQAARASEAFTVYDGLLADPPYPALDFLSEAYDGSALSASRLQTLASCPFSYFVKYVLGVRPLDEDGIETDGWLTPAQRGSILHDTFERFLHELDEPPTDDHWDALRQHLRARLDEEREQLEAPHPSLDRAAERQLLADARVFLRAEARSPRDARPRFFELSFGFPPWKQTHDYDRTGWYRLPLTEDCTFLFRGKIDRVDALTDGGLVLWDYKTGSSRSFSPSDPLGGGATMQWLLYACALDDLHGGPVRAAGYFFTSVREAGRRLAFEPHDAHRQDAADLVRRLAALARSGTFPINPDGGLWRYGYARLCPDPGARKAQIKAKTYPKDRPAPPHLD
ncbi:MAG: PD-(D/E)XK nuclease family protein, partial [Bacteroidetes bacterium]|nr:PD-(D/E)XK nuclease family protein [Bacteroidota bacterium]